MTPQGKEAGGGKQLPALSGPMDKANVWYCVFRVPIKTPRVLHLDKEYQLEYGER